MLYSRYNAMPLPNKFPKNNQVQCEFVLKQDGYNYKPLENQVTNQIEYHVNFADVRLFKHFNTQLFAQDEIQVAEMIDLCHLKLYVEKYLCDANSNFLPQTIVQRQNKFSPTPVIIGGIERNILIHTEPNSHLQRPNGLYGQQFYYASDQAIQSAIEYLNIPQTVNLICMAAIQKQPDFYIYNQEQIQYTLQTAYTSFRAAVIEANNILNLQSNQKPYVVIHTGNWGCGAYGNSNNLISLIQLLAAEMAGVNKLVYHTFNAQGSVGYKDGENNFINLLTQSFSSSEQLINYIAQKNFKWGNQDGN